MKQFLKFFAGIILLLTALQVKAQTNAGQSVEMADILHQNGKIYLVVLVLVTIFAGVLFMLFRIEKKLNQLEKNHGNR